MALGGMKGFFAALDNVANVLSSDEVGQIAHESWDIVTEQIRDNAASNGFFDTGLLQSRDTILTNSGVVKGRDGGAYVYAEAGVFKDDSAMLSFGVDPIKDIPRAQVAYWLEYGTLDHFVGLETTGEPVKGIKPSYFMTSAYDAKNEQAFSFQVTCHPYS